MTTDRGGRGPVLVPARVARGGRGAVVAPHHLATEAGLGILRAGGSAVDAAIAANAALAVVGPLFCGIGGDAFWLIWDAAERRQHALNGSGRAALSADPAALRATGLERLPLHGPLTITVPGAVRSWSDAHARFGRLSRAEVLAPAIELAGRGFPAWDGFIRGVEVTASRVEEATGAGSGFAQVFRPDGRPWRPGEMVRLPALAKTLERMADVGFDDFYAGDIAERQARGLAAAGSPLRSADLAGHTSTWGDPIATDYRGVRVTSHPPNSSGPVALEIINILERFEPPPADAFGPAGVADARWIHLGIEASKLAMADRDAELTDPDFRDIPLERLISKEYAAELASRIDPRHASSPVESSAPARRRHRIPRGGGRRGQRRQPHRVELHGLRVRRGRSRYWHPLPEPWLLLQPRSDAPERPGTGQADAAHAAAGHAVPR